MLSAAHTSVAAPDSCRRRHPTTVSMLAAALIFRIAARHKMPHTVDARHWSFESLPCCTRNRRECVVAALARISTHLATLSVLGSRVGST